MPANFASSGELGLLSMVTTSQCSADMRLTAPKLLFITSDLLTQRQWRSPKQGWGDAGMYEPYIAARCYVASCIIHAQQLQHDADLVQVHCRYKLRSAVDIADVSDEYSVWVQFGSPPSEQTGQFLSKSNSDLLL